MERRSNLEWWLGIPVSGLAAWLTAAYVLVVPRMKVYSFLVLLPATLFLVQESAAANRLTWVALVALPRKGSMLPGELLRPLDEYSAWLGAVLVFGLLVSVIRSRPPNESPPIATPFSPKVSPPVPN